jgi:predicted Zn-dependent peptidase
MVEDNPEDHIHVLFNHLFWMDHPIGMSILGTGETVSGIGKETILKYRSKYYIPEKILVVAAGDVDHQTMVSYFEPLFDSLEGGNSNPEKNTPRSNAGVSVHSRDLEQVHICLGGEGPSQTDDKRFACAVLSTILGGNMSSRLFQEIREKRGLAYSVYSFLSTYVDTGILGVYVATESRNVNPSLETIRTEIKKISEGDISDSDLAAAVDHLIGGIYLSSESADNRMMRNAKNEFVFEKYIGYEELVSELEQVTIDDVVEVANGIFQDGKVSLTALGPIKEEDIDMTNLHFR